MRKKRETNSNKMNKIEHVNKISIYKLLIHKTGIIIIYKGKKISVVNARITQHMPIIPNEHTDAINRLSAFSLYSVYSDLFQICIIFEKLISIYNH